ncbi:MAG: PaaI family thioesterase [Pseudomonadota bacterium]
MALKLDATEIVTFVESVFDQVRGDFVIERLDEDGMRVRMNVGERHLRPGGTVSGPSMFALVDVSAYFMTIAHIGREALTVTTSCAIDFMRKPRAGADLVAEVTLLKMGRQLSVSNVLVYSEGMDTPVAHASVTYSIPPER